ncbi:MAG: type II secretion system protein, partial [bacterium]
IKNKGFTFINLLLIAAVIGIFVSIVLVFLENIEKEDRDSLRKKEIVEIGNYLLTYYNSLGKEQFPEGELCQSSIGSCDNACPCLPPRDNWDFDSGLWQALIDKKITDSLPLDPLNDANHFYYYKAICNRGVCKDKGCCKGEICISAMEKTGFGYCYRVSPED